MTANGILHFKSTDQENFDTGFDPWFEPKGQSKKSLSCMGLDSSDKIWLKLLDCPKRSVLHINFGLDLYVWFESKNYEKKI